MKRAGPNTVTQRHYGDQTSNDYAPVPLCASRKYQRSAQLFIAQSYPLCCAKTDNIYERFFDYLGLVQVITEAVAACLLPIL